MTFEGHVKSVYGELMFQVTALTMQLDSAMAKIAELEAENKKLKDTALVADEKEVKE